MDVNYSKLDRNYQHLGSMKVEEYLTARSQTITTDMYFLDLRPGGSKTGLQFVIIVDMMSMEGPNNQAGMKIPCIL